MALALGRRPQSRTTVNKDAPSRWCRQVHIGEGCTRRRTCWGAPRGADLVDHKVSAALKQTSPAGCLLWPPARLRTQWRSARRQVTTIHAYRMSQGWSLPFRPLGGRLLRATLASRIGRHASCKCVDVPLLVKPFPSRGLTVEGVYNARRASWLNHFDIVCASVPPRNHTVGALSRHTDCRFANCLKGAGDAMSSAQAPKRSRKPPGRHAVSRPPVRGRTEGAGPR
jgi:hypothetical protein